MTVSVQNISGLGSSWSAYTLGISNDREKATLIHGNTAIGDALIDSIDYKSGNFLRYVVSFAEEDNVTAEQGRAITKEFFDSFMYGFEKDEYHLDIVEHADTKYLHYHGRMPKINLVTQTQLKAYYHNADLNFLKATIADIAHRHGLIIGMDKKKLIKDPTEVKERIAKWRAEHKEKALDFTNKKGKEMAEMQLTDHISDAVASGLINDLDSVKTELAAIGLDVVNEGYDRPRGFHYVTVQKDNVKIRLKGDIYDGRFYKLNRTDRREKISSNSALERRTDSDRADGTQISINLHRERQKRSKWIAKQYKAGRKRAVKRANEASQHEQIKPNQNTQTAIQIFTTWSVSPGINYRYLSNPTNNKIKDTHDSTDTPRTEISRSIRARADKQRGRTDSINNVTKRVTKRTKSYLQSERINPKSITKRRKSGRIRRYAKAIRNKYNELNNAIKYALGSRNSKVVEVVKEGLKARAEREGWIKTQARKMTRAGITPEQLKEHFKSDEIIRPNSEMKHTKNNDNSNSQGKGISR